MNNDSGTPAEMPEFFVIDIIYCNFKVIGIIQEQKPMLLYTI